MGKYIKNVNWPWVEILTEVGDSTALLNVNELTTIWNFFNGHYNSGVRYKNGDWCEILFSDDALAELKTLIMNHKDTPDTLPRYALTQTVIENLTEEQSMFEWLQENGQA